MHEAEPSLCGWSSLCILQTRDCEAERGWTLAAVARLCDKLLTHAHRNRLYAPISKPHLVKVKNCIEKRRVIIKLSSKSPTFTKRRQSPLFGVLPYIGKPA